MIRRTFVLFFLLMNCFAYTQKQTDVSSSKRLTKFLNEKKWNELFPHRYKNSSGKSTIDFYSFQAFKNAVQHFPLFLNEGNDVAQKRELAAFLAMIATETGNNYDKAEGGFEKWELYYAEEKGCEKGCPQYTDTTKKLYPPVAGKSYHGRGPIQLSWNYNYGQFSEFYFGKKDSLLHHPELLSTNAELAFASALWFWMTAQYPKPSCHDVMSGKWIPSVKDSVANRLPGFGTVINIVNGGLECGANNHSATTNFRFRYYQYFCKYFGVSMGEHSSCETQKPFGVN